ncbi:GNAT family N-acetyltransferase [Deinococcus peraridilitoris]|uniref:Acetyltransferase n=1 Tax=Deinococcus peraridilitoris (strain DSM 19664 / LMG 22246 / CIP 109416 / KR-200) TaxID=937777 RepID=L0A2S9_DEIPD|nr:GNAT family N-acetyltransferase [Deinococcus peraridilitoris]AFZ68188.1 acetyltransferase [Deinococcus peraridilitoris DSM 19664]
MIRPMRQGDARALLSLLEWMDAQPEREVLAPEPRTVADLCWDREGKHGLVRLGRQGQLRAYCALTPFEGGGHILEGPVGRGPFRSLLKRALRRASDSVYAFCAQDNMPAREALEEAGFWALHTTDFYRLPRIDASRRPTLPEGTHLEGRCDFTTYRQLYRCADDSWSARLGWSATEFRAHLAREDLRLLVLRRDAKVAGFAELELGHITRLTYLAVHPAERGRGYGGLLLQAAAQQAFADPSTTELQVRAHDHEVAARRLYLAHGFTPCRSVVTYLYDTALK